MPGDGVGDAHVPVHEAVAEEAVQAGGPGAVPLLQRPHPGDCCRLPQRIHPLLERYHHETGANCV